MRINGSICSVGLVVLLWPSIASAEFLGVDVYSFDQYFRSEHPSVNVRQAWHSIGHGQLDVYRVYAEFDSPESVSATFGISASGQPMYLSNLDSGTFWNFTTTQPGSPPSITHYDTAPASSLFDDPATAAAAFDTFATIGPDRDDTTTLLASGVSSGTSHFQSDWTSADFGDGPGWFSTGVFDALPGGDQPGMPNDGIFRVLLFQFTVAQGEIVEGQFGVSTAGQGNMLDHRSFFSTSTVPMPSGAVVLVAALGASRRRRR